MDKVKIEVSFDKIVSSEQAHDSKLERNLQSALGNTGDYIRGVVELTLHTIDGTVEPIDYIGIRIVASKKLGMGYAFPAFRHAKAFPSIVVGFAGDVAEFKKTIIHEILHYVGWTEYITEKRTEEIYKEEVNG